MPNTNGTYDAPRVKVILLSTGDIITTSGPDSGGGESGSSTGGENSGEWDIDNGYLGLSF